MAKSCQNPLASSAKSTLNQPFTSQASNNLWFHAQGKFKPPEISVEKMSTHIAQKIAFLLPDKKHECSLAYNQILMFQSVQHNSNNTKWLCKLKRKCPMY